MSAPRPLRAQHRALPLARWPAPDRDAWDTAHRRPDFLEIGGHGASWRPASQVAARGSYGRWLGWLKEQGVILEDEAPADRITSVRVRSYITFLQQGRSTMTVASYLGILCMVVLAIFPENDWHWLKAVQTSMQRRSAPSRNKRERLVPADQLMQLGLDLTEAAKQTLDQLGESDVNARQLVAAARDYRDGLTIALLALRPLRVKNLLAIEIGQHLRQSGGRPTLHFTASETKNGRSLDAVWPESLQPALTHYLQKVRPRLIAAKAPIDPAHPSRPLGAKLWVAQGGTPLTAGGLYKALGRHTRRRFGHAINAHLFRDCVASTMANQDPNRCRYAAQLLGHRNLYSTEQSYIHADSQIALHQHHDLISAMRGDTRQRRRAVATKDAERLAGERLATAEKPG